MHRLQFTIASALGPWAYNSGYGNYNTVGLLFATYCGGGQCGTQYFSGFKGDPWDTMRTAAAFLLIAWLASLVEISLLACLFLGLKFGRHTFLILLGVSVFITATCFLGVVIGGSKVGGESV